MEFSHLKLITFIIIFIALYYLEQHKPYFAGRNNHLQHSFKNLSLAAINVLINIVLLFLIFSQLFIWVEEHQLGLLQQTKPNALFTLLIAIILMDLWQYWWHRINHTIPLLWRIHRVHHADKQLDASSALRFHPLEIVLSACTKILAIPLIGIELEQLIIYETIVLLIILFHHSNIDLNDKMDGALRLLIVTPNMHRLHHSELRRETDSNYASVFSIWDRLFGSYTMRSIKNNFNLGLGDKFTEKQWNSVPGMLKIPFFGKDD